MLKYLDTKITFSEIPDEITLCISITGCKIGCKNCHSSYLAKDIGEVLTIGRVEKLLEQNRGVTAICFMGGDNDPKLVNHYAKLIKASHVQQIEYTYKADKDVTLPKGVTLKSGDPIAVIKHVPNPIKIGWYSGRQELSKEIDLNNFDFIKLGPYLEEYGPLNYKTTNQKFYKVVHTSMGTSKMYDITHRFWKNETED